MWKHPENDQFVDELYLAGELVPAGTYRQVGSGREVKLDAEDRLPASLDGRVACYIRVQQEWKIASTSPIHSSSAKAVSA